MFRCIRTLQFQKRDGFFLLAAGILLLLGLLQWWIAPLTMSLGREISNPYYTTMDEQGNYYIINDGKSEILKTNPQGKITARLSWDSHEEDAFGEADEVAVDSRGNIYVLDINWNDTGLGLARERILRYDSRGRFQSVVFENDYSEQMVMKRHCFSLRILDGNLVFAAVSPTEDMWTVYTLTEDAEKTSSVAEVSWKEAESIQDISIASLDEIYVIDKKGTIRMTDTKSQQVVYEEEENRYKLPYFIASGENGVSYFTDICNQEIYRIKDGKASVLYDQTRLAQLTGLDVSGSVLETLQAVNRDGKEYLCVTCNDGVSVIDIQGETGQTFDTLSYRGGFQILLILRFAAFILAGLIAVYYLLVLLRYLIASGVLVRKKFSLILILGVSVSALVVMTNMLRRFQEDYVEEQIDNMCTVTQIAAAIIDTRDLEQVKYPSDYGTAEYQNLQQAMNKLIDVSSIYSENLYCNLVKMTDDRYYALAYLDNSIGAYYPLDESEVQEVQEVYDTGESYINDGKSDATGSYVYVKTPVEDAAGNVMGVVEVGMVSNTLSQKVSSLRNSIMIEILLMIIIAVFVLNEGFAFTEDYREWKRLKQNRSKVFPQSYLRVITFLCFAAYNMPSSFLPVYVEQFYNDSLPFGIGLAGSLPLTVNFAMIGIMSVFCPKLLRKFGFQVTMAAGAVLCMTGDITMAFAGNYWVVAGGLLANGIGCGLVMNGLSIMVASQEGEDQTKGFAIINGEILSGMICGTVIGAAIAERIGKSTMFLFSFGLWVILLAILIVTGKFFSMGKEKKTARKSSLGQLWSVDVMGYLLLVVVPYTIVNGFTSYFLPVFADSYGLGESQTSLLLVMNCLVGIFLSGVLTNICIKYLGRGAILLSTVLSLGAVVIFGYFQNLYMLAFTLFLLGAAKSFGATSREILFCEAKDVQSMGEDRAMGYYNLADNLGESLGVVVFGGIMSVGFLSGMWMLAGVSVVMLGLQEILHHHHIRHRDT